jgi:serine/threonine protein kinase
MASVEHEMVVWQAIELKNQENENYLVSLEKLEFTNEARLEHGLMGGGTRVSHEDIAAGILMEKYQSTLARCTIALTETVLLRFGVQLQTALSVMHSCGYCHMDVKPANIFLEKGDCFLGDYGASTRFGEKVKEYTVGYYPSDAGETAEKETDFLLLAVTLMEMFDCIKSPPVSMTKAAIKEKVANVENENVKVFLQSLTVPPP